MKSMKNIKPAYAVKLGKGVFSGAEWQCKYCGKMITASNQPYPTSYGKCPESNSGQHAWFKA